MTKVSMSFVVALVIIGPILAGCVAMILVGAVMRRRNKYDSDAWLAVGAGATVAVITLAAAAWGLYPYDMDYHRYRHVSGTVAEVQTRMLASGDGGSTVNYAIRLADGVTYRCDDTRCSLLKPDDQLALWCIREWQYASTSGWVCRFDVSTPAGAR